MKHWRMQLLVLSLVLCACANGLAVRENKTAPSPLVYETYSDAGRYAIVNQPTSWVDAAQICRLTNGHLAFPKTSAEYAVLKNSIANDGTSYHIGFHDQFQEGKYLSVKYQELGAYLTWAPGQPDGQATQNCGGLRADGIVDLDCADKRPFICEEEGPLIPGGLVGYEQIGQYGLFKISDDHTDWSVGVERCQAEGAHMWIVNSAAELAAVYDHYKIELGGLHTFWTGAHHVYVNHVFVTIFDEELAKTGFSSWVPGHPTANNTQYPYAVITDTGLMLSAGARLTVCEYNNPPCSD